MSSTYGSDGRVLDSRIMNPYLPTAEYQYFVDYDSAGRPVALSGKLASEAQLTKVYEVVPSQGTSGGYGGYDAVGRVPLMRADDGRVVSARRYSAFSGALLGECKRFGDALACGSVSGSGFGSPPALDPATDIYRTDQVAATYRGAKLASYVDSGTATSDANTYLPNGRLSTSQAAPSGTVGSLTQDWLESFLFNGIGNLSRVDAQRNTTSGNGRPARYETEWYTPETPGAGKALDRVVAVGSQLLDLTKSPPEIIRRTAAATPGSTSYSYDLLGHLTQVTRTSGESETLAYAPGGELVSRQVGERFTFYLGEYATVTASGLLGCGSSCVPQASTVEVDAHVVFAGTRIASVKPSRTLYYYRTRLGTVVATSLGGGVPGAGYRYTAYGEVELSVNETDATRSELGYTNALRLTGSLLYLKNRVYDAEARVFVQPDTVDRLRYAYVMGDPVNLSDPTGLATPQDSGSPIVGRTVSYTGSFVVVVEKHADGSTTRQVYNLEVPTEREAWNDYKTALQKEQGILQRLGNAAGTWVKEKVVDAAKKGFDKATSWMVDPYRKRTDETSQERLRDVESGREKMGSEGAERLGQFAAEEVERAIDDAPYMILGGVAARALKHGHHLLPKQFKPFFKEAGLDIEEYKINLDPELHLRGVHGRGLPEQGLPGGWNQIWEKWIEENRGAKDKQILEQLHKMIQDFNLLP